MSGTPPAIPRGSRCECPQRASCEAAPAPQRHAQPCEWPELRPDHHRPDDQDLRVLNDPESRDHRREDHEGEIADESSALSAGLLLYRLPDDGVGRVSRLQPPPPSSGIRDERRDGVRARSSRRGRGRATKLRRAGVLAGDVAEEEVAAGSLRHVADADDIDSPRDDRAERGAWRTPAPAARRRGGGSREHEAVAHTRLRDEVARSRRVGWSFLRI